MEEVAALVSYSSFRLVGVDDTPSSVIAHQVIDNGSGMCKAGCEYFVTFAQMHPD